MQIVNTGSKIWIIREGDERGPTVGFLNVTLRKLFWVDTVWKGFYRNTAWIALLQMGSIFIAFGVVFYFGRMFESWLIFWVLLIGVFIGIWKFTGQLEDTNHQNMLRWQEDINAILVKRYG